MSKNNMLILCIGFWSTFLFAPEIVLYRHPANVVPVVSAYELPLDYRVSLETKCDLRISNWYITRRGYIASTKEYLLDRAIRLAVSGNEMAFKKLITSNPDLFPLRGGLKVQLQKSSWPGKVKIRPENSDLSIWTIKEAIE